MTDGNRGKFIFVANGGDDESGDGTLENPYRTMAKAYSEVTDGGRIEVGPGTYEEASLTIDTGVTITGSEVEGE